MKKSKNNQYVRIGTLFLNTELSVSAAKVMFLLASMAQARGESTVIVSNKRIAERTGLTNIARLTKELYAAGAITECTERYRDNLQISNAYTLCEALVSPKCYKFLPSNAVKLPASAFRLLSVYTMMCNDFGRCVLSLSELHDVSGMSRSTITAANQILQDKNYIAKQRYVTYEGDYGHNRVYVTHILRNLHTMKCAETIRILVNGGEMSYSVKCILEGAMQADRKTAYQMLRKEIRRLFRSTKVAKFIRKLRRNRNVTAIFLGKKHGSLRKICRLLYSYLL